MTSLQRLFLSSLFAIGLVFLGLATSRQAKPSLTSENAPAPYTSKRIQKEVPSLRGSGRVPASVAALPDESSQAAQQVAQDISPAPVKPEANNQALEDPQTRTESLSRKEIEFLQKMRLEDPEKAIFNSRIFQYLPEDQKKLEGQFKGHFYGADESFPAREIRVRIQLGSNSLGSVVNAQMQLKLTDDSLSEVQSFEASINSDRTLETEGTIVRLTRTSFAQLFYNSVSDQWLANYYSIKDSENFRFIAMSKLSRF